MHATDFNTDKKYPIYILRGSDTYLKDKVTASITALIEERDINISIFTDADIFGVLDALSVAPLFGDYRLAIVRGYDKKLSQKEKDALTAYAGDPAYGSILLIDDTADAFKFLAKHACTVECNSSDEYYIIGWVKSELKDHELSAGSAELLVKLCGKDMQRISGEINKLKAFAARTKKINTGLIAELISRDSDIQVYELTNHLAKKDYPSAIAVYNTLTQRGEDSVHLLSLLTNQYRRMLYAAISPLGVAELADILKVKEFAVTKAKEAAKNYTKQGLRKIVDTLTTLEYEFKSGTMNDKTALDCAMAYLTAV